VQCSDQAHPYCTDDPLSRGQIREVGTYLISTGKVTQNNVPTPMYIMARLNLDAQAISVANEHKDLKLGTSAAPLKAVHDLGNERERAHRAGADTRHEEQVGEVARPALGRRRYRAMKPAKHDVLWPDIVMRRHHQMR
jgi:hypothetical protein